MILLNDIWDMNKYETCGMVLYFSVPLETKGMSCHWIILHISEVLYPISEEALRSKRALAGASDSAIHHFLSIFTPHSVLSLSQTADCHEFCTQPERFQDTSPWNLLSSRVRCSQINTSVWMPHYKVSEFYYEELGEEFNIHGKKKNQDILRGSSCGALYYTARCEIHIRHSATAGWLIFSVYFTSTTFVLRGRKNWLWRTRCEN